MNIIDIMTRNVQRVSLKTSVADAIDQMQTQGIRHLVVVNSNGDLVGIVSDRDLRLAAQSPYAVWEEEKADEFANSLLIEQVMTESPHCIGALDSVAEAAQLMIDEQISAIPVMRDRDIVGIVTTVDLLEIVVAQTA